MSSILNALKKLEQHKQRETQRASNLPIDAAIIQEETVGNNKPLSGVALTAAALLLFLGGGTAAYLTLRPTQQQNVVTLPHEQQNKAPIPLPPTDKPAAQKPLATPAPAQKITPPPSPRQAQVQPSLSPQAAPIQKTPVPAPTSAPKATVRPSLKVLGIASESGDPSSSVAIVNGTPVTTGGEIEGARVEAIMKDRVRFSFSGETFEVLLKR